MQHLVHFIWVFTSCKSTHLGVSHIQRVKVGKFAKDICLKVRSYCPQIKKGKKIQVLDDFLVSVKVPPHECVIRTGQAKLTHR